MEGFSPLHSVSLHLVWAFSAVESLPVRGRTLWRNVVFRPPGPRPPFSLDLLELSSILWFGGFFLGWSVWDEVTLLPVLS